MDIEGRTFEDRFQAIKESQSSAPVIEDFNDEPPGQDWSSDATVTASNATHNATNGNANGKKHTKRHSIGDESDEEEGIQEEANLNMCSAYTVRSGVCESCFLSRYESILTHVFPARLC